MTIFIIIFLTIIIPYISPYAYRRKSLLISMLILFIPFGLQYEMTCDWSVHLQHWQYANGLANLYGRELEPIYKFLCVSSKPITYFGWLMLSAFIELAVLYFFIRKKCPLHYYWVAMAVLMLYNGNAFLMINSNRQTWALMFTMIGTVFLFMEEFFDYVFPWIKKVPINRLIVATLFYILAIFTHGGAIAALGLIPLYYFARMIKRLNTPLIFLCLNMFFCSRFVWDASYYQQLASMFYASTGLVSFEQYIDEIMVQEDQPIVFNILYGSIMNLILITYHKLPPFSKFAALAMILVCIFSAYLTGNVQRILQYYYIYSIVLIPNIFYVINYNYKDVKYIHQFGDIIAIVLLLLISYDLYKVIVFSPYYNKWLHFETIFEASHWI